MIRVSQIGKGSTQRFLVEGTLSNSGVDALQAIWFEAQSQRNGRSVCIDLSGVTYIDDKGRKLLSRIIRSGVEIRTAGILTRTVVEEITKEVEPNRTN